MNMNPKNILALFYCFYIIVGCSSCSASPKVSGSLMEINEDGTMSKVEPYKKSECQLSGEELILKQDDIASSLMELNYIERSVVVLCYPPEKEDQLCFLVNLHGEDLEEHIEEISTIVVSQLGSCDLDNSLITDDTGNIIYPAQ